MNATATGSKDGVDKVEKVLRLWRERGVIDEKHVELAKVQLAAIRKGNAAAGVQQNKEQVSLFPIPGRVAFYVPILPSPYTITWCMASLALPNFGFLLSIPVSPCPFPVLLLPFSIWRMPGRDAFCFHDNVSAFLQERDRIDRLPRRRNISSCVAAAQAMGVDEYGSNTPLLLELSAATDAWENASTPSDKPTLIQVTTGDVPSMGLVSLSGAKHNAVNLSKTLLQSTIIESRRKSLSLPACTSPMEAD